VWSLGAGNAITSDDVGHNLQLNNWIGDNLGEVLVVVRL